MDFANARCSRAALERHEERRGQGIPTITALVGDPAEAAALWEEWATREDGNALVSAGSTVQAVLEDLRRSKIADLARERLVARCAESRATSVVQWWCAFDAKSPRERRESLAVAEDALLRRGDRATPLLFGLLEPEFVSNARSAGPVAVFAAWGEVLAPERLALLLTLGSDAERSLAMAGALVDAVPRACVAVALGDDVAKALGPLPPRLAAMLREGSLRLTTVSGDGRPPPGRKVDPSEKDHARSRAERTLFEGLEQSAHTRGLFRLNQGLPIFFGGRAAEIDLLCVGLKVAVEVDGYHHFREPDAYRRDRRKDVLLQKDGYLVVRVLADDVMARTSDVVAQVRDAVEHRRSLDRPGSNRKET